LNIPVLTFFLFDYLVREVELTRLDPLLVLVDIVLEWEGWLTAEHFIGKKAVQEEINRFVVALTLENFWYLIGQTSTDESLGVALFKQTLLRKSKVR